MARNAEVHAVEGEADMLRALDKAWRHATGLKRVTTETRDLFRRPLQPDELRKFDAAIIDPPRAGAEAQIDELSASDINLIAYVSCNPTTFARSCAFGFTWFRNKLYKQSTNFVGPLISSWLQNFRATNPLMYGAKLRFLLLPEEQ